jgi:hypothetical protein
MTKLSLFLVACVFGLSAQALNFNGYIVIENGKHLLVDRETARTFNVEPSSAEVRKSLNLLTTFDGLRGQVASKEGDTLQLDTIDFVSLGRLLGEWTDGSARVSFEDYSRVKFEMDGNDRMFLYALSPGANNGWRIYLTDQTSVVLGSLNVEGNAAVLEFYDPQTGQTAQRLQLSKVVRH